MKKLVTKKERNEPINSSKRTVQSFITDWLEVHIKPNKSPSTFRGYEQHARTHIYPVIGRKSLELLTGRDVQACLNAAAAKNLSPTTVKNLNQTLKSALTTAQKWGYISSNAAKNATPPKQIKFDARPLTLDEANQLLKSVDGHRYEALTSVGISLGLRRGEIAGLRWENINWATGVLRITHSLQRIKSRGMVLRELKSETSHREISMPQFCLDALRKRQLVQEQEKIDAGIKWKDTGFVFTERGGGVIQTEKVTTEHRAALKLAKLHHVRFHDLRHTAATLLLSKGVPMKMIQAILGHSSFQFTMSVYGHLVAAMHSEAAQAMDDLFLKPVVAPMVGPAKVEVVH
jgi:integrase